MFFFLIACCILSAQDYVDLFEVDYRLSPSVVRTDTIGSSANISDFSLQILYPQVIDSNRTRLHSLRYHQLRIAPYRLHSISAFVGYDQRISTRGRLLALLIPKLNSDLSNVSSKDVQLGGYFLYTNKRSEALRWKLGVYTNTDLFGPLAVPILGFRYQASPSLRVDCSLPVAAHIRKTISDRLITGIKYSGRRYSFLLAESQEYMEVSDNHVWAYLDAYIHADWVIQLRLGHSVLRSYSLHALDEQMRWSMGLVDFGDNRGAARYERGQGLSLQVGLRYRYDTARKK